jgi:LysM repeat protein
MFDDEAGDGPGDDSGFWDDMPTSRLDRLSAMRTPRPGMPSRAPRVRRAGSVGAVGSRHHDDTGSVPVMSGSTSGPAGITGRMRTVTDHVDPLLRRMGVVALIVALAVPVAMAARRSDSSASPLQPDTSTLAQGADPAAGAGDAADLGAAGAADVTDPATELTTAGSHTSARRTSGAAPRTASATTTVATKATTTTTIAVADVSAAAQAQRVSSVSRNCPKTYKVAAGQGWYVIAKKVGVPLKDLLAVNHARTSTKLYPGGIICLPIKAVVTTTTVKPTTTTKKPTTTTTVKVAPKVTTTTAKPTPAAHVYTRAEVIQIIRDTWPDNLEDEAIRIATRESNLVPTAKNACCYGLFQIYFNVHKGWLATIGVTSAAQLLDPKVNAYAALVMYVRAGGWGPWA